VAETRPIAELTSSIARALDERADGIVSAYVFGSHAEGRAHSESDVDVGVLFDYAAHTSKTDRFEQRVELTSVLIHALHDNAVDVVVLNDAPATLGRRIVTHGLRAFCVDDEADRAFVRDVQLCAVDLDLWLRRMRTLKLEASRTRTSLVERLTELRRHLDHLHALCPRVRDATSLEADLSLHNDVLFSLLSVCQLVIDIAGELSSCRGDRFEDYTQAVRNLSRDSRFPADVVRVLERLPGFRNVLIHAYVALDMDRVVAALDDLAPVERFVEIVGGIEAE
jgi:uncharacterized protein YutE (UPF0331/DUF86 family)/predicted nucleotidyltransferase